MHVQFRGLEEKLICICTTTTTTISTVIFLLMTRWPFDWKAPIGYLVAWLGEAVGFFSFGLAGVPFYAYLFGSGWLFAFMAKDMRKDLKSFNINIAKATENNDDEHHVGLTKQFCSIIQIYINAKE